MKMPKRRPQFLPNVTDPVKRNCVVNALAAILDVWHSHPELSKIDGPDLEWANPRLPAKLQFLFFSGIPMEPGQVVPKFCIQMSIFTETVEQATHLSDLVRKRFDHLLIRGQDQNFAQCFALILEMTSASVIPPHLKERVAHAATVFHVGMFQAPEIEDAVSMAYGWVERHFTPKRGRIGNEFP
jgi:hypothetical protein